MDKQIRKMEEQVSCPRIATMRSPLRSSGVQGKAYKRMCRVLRQAVPGRQKTRNISSAVFPAAIMGWKVREWVCLVGGGWESNNAKLWRASISPHFGYHIFSTIQTTLLRETLLFLLILKRYLTIPASTENSKAKYRDSKNSIQGYRNKFESWLATKITRIFRLILTKFRTK